MNDNMFLYASKQESRAVTRKSRDACSDAAYTLNDSSIVIYIHRIKADVNVKLLISNNTMPCVIYRTPILPEISEYTFGVDPWIRVKTRLISHEIIFEVFQPRRSGGRTTCRSYAILRFAQHRAVKIQWR